MENNKSKNPIVPGWYADPEARIYEGQYWIYPTTSDVYEKQIQMDAFYSDDLIHWKKAENILDTSTVPWLRLALWAPTIAEKNGKYYYYFATNDIHSEEEVGGLGVAVSDSPAGPFRSPFPHPLLNEIRFGAQPIDPHVFLDDDGTAYLYYGGWGHCNVCLLDDSMIALKPFPDGELIKSITPEGYVEGPCMFKKDGKYYFMWSEGGWGGPDYRVAYSIADSPLGPFDHKGVILSQDPAVAVGCGHHGYLHPEGGDDWYIVYHRRPLGDNEANHRALCIDRMYFDDEGNILPVKITREGVEAHPLDPQ